METQPTYVERAFRTFYYGGQYEIALDAFLQRWGGTERETLTQVLSTGTQEEQAIALFIIGYSGIPQAQELLRPFLHSHTPLLRWVSALCLGELKDEQALPVLINLLDEFLPPRLHPFEREGGLYQFWRIKAVSLLGAWQRDDLAPVLRRALVKSWELEQADTIDRKQVWHPYQDELVYNLGRLGAFGSLTSFALPAPRLHLWLVMLSCGSLQARTRYGDLLTQLQINATLQQEVTHVLELRFGIPAEEGKQCVEQCADHAMTRMEWGKEYA